MLTPAGQKIVEKKGLLGREEGKRYLAAVKVTDTLWRVWGVGHDELGAYSLSEMDTNSPFKSVKAKALDCFSTWSRAQGDVGIAQGAILKVDEETASLVGRTRLLMLKKEGSSFICDRAASIDAAESKDLRDLCCIVCDEHAQRAHR